MISIFLWTGLMDTLFFESTQLKQLIEEGKDAL